jgi:hypothetical protein
MIFLMEYNGIVQVIYQISNSIHQTLPQQLVITAVVGFILPFPVGTSDVSDGCVNFQFANQLSNLLPWRINNLQIILL